MSDLNSELAPAATVDITREACPMTYVRTKLSLEALSEGEVLEVLLRGDEPLRNVPRTALGEGHRIVSMEESSTGVWRLFIQKGKRG
jgi:tRNA 2-thiouridine synthesizing protein A